MKACVNKRTFNLFEEKQRHTMGSKVEPLDQPFEPMPVRYPGYFGTWISLIFNAFASFKPLRGCNIASFMLNIISTETKHQDL